MLDGFSRVRHGRPGHPVYDERQSTEKKHNNYKITHHDRHLLLERYPPPLMDHSIVPSIQALDLIE
jgi:hypothetical protein